MGVITLDFNLEEESAGLPVGVYQFQIVDAVEAESSSGNPMVKLKLSVVNDPQYNGRMVFDNLVVTASMARRLKSFADAAGLDFRMGIDPSQMMNKIVWAEVSHEEWQGETNAKIKKYRVGR